MPNFLYSIRKLLDNEALMNPIDGSVNASCTTPPLETVITGIANMTPSSSSTHLQKTDDLVTPSHAHQDISMFQVTTELHDITSIYPNASLPTDSEFTNTGAVFFDISDYLASNPDVVAAISATVLPFKAIDLLESCLTSDQL